MSRDETLARLRRDAKAGDQPSALRYLDLLAASLERNRAAELAWLGAWHDVGRPGRNPAVRPVPGDVVVVGLRDNDFERMHRGVHWPLFRQPPRYGAVHLVVGVQGGDTVLSRCVVDGQDGSIAPFEAAGCWCPTSETPVSVPPITAPVHRTELSPNWPVFCSAFPPLRIRGSPLDPCLEGHLFQADKRCRDCLLTQSECVDHVLRRIRGYDAICLLHREGDDQAKIEALRLSAHGCSPEEILDAADALAMRRAASLYTSFTSR